MPTPQCSKTRLLLACAFVLLAAPVHAQFGGIGGAVRRGVEREVERQVEREVRERIRCALNDPACVERARKAGDEVEIVDAEGNVITGPDGQPVQTIEQAKAQTARAGANDGAGAGTGDAPGTGVWRNYDFVPGRAVWFALDLERERIGRFPASQLQFVSGNAQVVEKDGRRLIEATSDTTFYIDLPEALPDDFSLEFVAQNGAAHLPISVIFDPVTENKQPLQKYDRHYLRVSRETGLVRGSQMVSGTNNNDSLLKTAVPVRLQNDGTYAIAYVGEKRVANLPNAMLGRARRIEVQMRADGMRSSYIGDIVIAVGLDDLYGTLSSGNAWTTRGIHFDVDSDVLRPESTPVLSELKRTLDGHNDLSLIIEGHTDSTGDEAHNRELSERRAKSVVTWLVGQGIAADRLRAVGRGEAEPVADNGTLEGRQENRRVVVRRID